MRVLLWMIDGDRVPGGHRIQVEQTARYLNALGGVEAEVSFETGPALGAYDLIHGFGIGPAEMRECAERRLPVVLSTIYCCRDFYMGQHIARPRDIATYRGRVRVGLGLLRSALRGEHVEKCGGIVERLHTMRVAYEMADLLLPNSEREAATFRAELGVTTPCQVVPNAVDAGAFHMDGGAAASGERRGVLYVGRFEPHKNQLGLIEALRGLDIPLLLAGPPHPDHQEYYRQCRRRAAANVSILPAVAHEELPALYRSVRVHALPSWFETTGLVSLEAALCGCNVVTTDRGYAREYFGGTAWYCDPAHPATIRAAVEAAHRAPYRSGLRERILDNFTWEHTARATLSAYRQVLEGAGMPRGGGGTAWRQDAGNGAKETPRAVPTAAAS